MGFICLKNKFLQLKNYIQRIHLALLSTTCVKIHKIPSLKNVFFETMSHLSWLSSCVFFYLSHYILSIKVAHLSASFQTSIAGSKIYQIPHVIVWTRRQLFSEPCITCIRVIVNNSFVICHLNLYMLWAKRAQKSENFQTFDCSHEN